MLFRSEIEKVANAKKIPIMEPFQGAKIGAFTVMAPTKAHYLDMIVQSEKTPEAVADDTSRGGLIEGIQRMAARVAHFVKSAWGVEVFSTEETSAENEMSVVQYANLCEMKILLTGDSGRAGLSIAADFAPSVGLTLPGIDRFQIPHHGSRRNVSSEILDRWLGDKLTSLLEENKHKFVGIISSAKEDEHHPRKAVIRAVIHRGGKVITTEGSSIWSYKDAPAREGWSALPGEKYPEEQEE